MKENNSQPRYLISLAASGRSKCRTCNCRIEKNTLRVGLPVEGHWGISLSWQHLNCTIFQYKFGDVSDVDGFSDLNAENKKITTLRWNESKHEVDYDQQAINPDELVRKSWELPVSKISSDLLIPLLPYQHEGVGWMLHQEASEVHGGILADEMGMGKTIQCIALMLSNRSTQSETDQTQMVSNLKMMRAGTLIVLPTVAIRQWESEIARFTRAGSLKIIVYHGSDRLTRLADLASVDVVITSYKVIEMEYRKATAGTKVICRICNKKFYPDKLRLHRKYFCGVDAHRTEAQMKTSRKKQRVLDISQQTKNESHNGLRPVSIVTKKVVEEFQSDRSASKGDVSTTRSVNKLSRKRVLSDDESGSEYSSDDVSTSNSSVSSADSVAKRSVKQKGKMTVVSKVRSGKFGRPTLRGANRGDIPEDNDDNDRDDSDVERDIARAIANSSKAKPVISVLHQLSWFRIVLDEAHLIKDRSTSTAHAMFNLVSLNKWCLTGTPLQNRVGELYSLIRFLRMDPHAYYFCKSKDCDCKSLHYRFTKGRCDDCKHSVMQHYCHFNKHVLNPIKRWGYVAEGRTAMLKLKQHILDDVLLRRTKVSRADDILLPPRIVHVRQEVLDEKEEDFYQALYTKSQAQFNTYLKSGTVLNNYAHIFDILIRLRQAVDHPYLVIHSDTQQHQQQQSNPRNSCEECDLCHEPLDDPVYAKCGHCFCRGCITDYVASMQVGNPGNDCIKTSCPDCSANLDFVLNEKTTKQLVGRKKNILDKVDLSSFQSSTKIEALMQELYVMESSDFGAKAIVFSQFVNMLELLEYRMKLGGISCVKLLGSMNIDQRDKSLSSFREDSSVKVLLISLKAGGMALNLTVSSRIFLMDPWWNPAAEMQAIDRTHRIGQHKPIFATRFIAQNTIEERILQLQDKKKLVFDGTIGGDSTSMSKLTVDDMKFLFQ